MVVLEELAEEVMIIITIVIVMDIQNLHTVVIMEHIQNLHTVVIMEHIQNLPTVVIMVMERFQKNMEDITKNTITSNTFRIVPIPICQKLHFSETKLSENKHKKIKELS
uniref:Mantle gene 5 n=1 Tax=Pinctada fucata TaxID=50426 RepID=Q3YL61_PINFU|nr:mantle gene 5 [Pinctada fucata]ABY84934.1 mantle protein [Pinctada fucata]